MLNIHYNYLCTQCWEIKFPLQSQDSQQIVIVICVEVRFLFLVNIQRPQRKYLCGRIILEIACPINVKIAMKSALQGCRVRVLKDTSKTSITEIVLVQPKLIEDNTCECHTIEKIYPFSV